ncbi:MAG: diguanylate cyclase [Clostridiales bacterium]|jgi:diguanylate cyclase (GGDEF)-like protein|nr:diguanylate cyclase [Clostridiales bacterium]
MKEDILPGVEIVGESPAPKAPKQPPKDRQSVLIVDDETSNLMMLNKMLSSEYQIYVAKNGQEALRHAINDKPDLILLDIIMPGISGFDVLRRLHESVFTREIPVIIITGLNSDNDEELGYFYGAVDYITKPFKEAVVKARLRVHMKMARLIRTVESFARIDTLTNLPNRRGFKERIDVDWKRAARLKKPLSVVVLDVDGMRDYNELYGHPQGDAMLKTVAKALNDGLGGGQSTARLGADSFAVFLYGVDSAGAEAAATRIRDVLNSTPIPVDDGKLVSMITVSTGFATADPSDRSGSSEALINAAAAAVRPPESPIAATENSGQV